MTLATIDDLNNELLGLVKALPAFKNVGFSVFTAEDLDEKRGLSTLPVVGVSYEGCESADKESSNVAATARGASVIVMQFAVLIAIQYSFNGESGETRTQAHQLLDQTRRAVQGFKGVNSRGWRFIGEQPLPEPSGDGVVYYAQVWQTTLPSIGNFNQP